MKDEDRMKPKAPYAVFIPFGRTQRRFILHLSSFAFVLLLAACSGPHASVSLPRENVSQPLEQLHFDRPCDPTFECSTDFIAQNPIDTYMLAAWRRRGIEPANLCSDTVFIRRVYLDVIGTLPEPADVLAFVADTAADKRARLIDALLQRDEFADYWALKWCDLLRVKAEFPINLWPNAVQAYHRWIHDAVRDGMPYDEFVRQLLTSSGSNFRAPPVNFYRAVQGRDPTAIAGAVGLTFMGVRAGNWPEAQRAGMAAFFKRVAYKKTDEWKEEIVYCDPNSVEALEAVFPDGVQVSIPPEKDPRAVFADWLIAPDNPWFTRNIANRVWSWLLGRGIIHEPDDIRPDNPPANPELLAYLESELVAAHYDMRQPLSADPQFPNLPAVLHRAHEPSRGARAVRVLPGAPARRRGVD